MEKKIGTLEPLRRIRFPAVLFISQPQGIRGESEKMRCIVKNEIYVHRGVWITRYNQGIGTEFDLNLFRTFADARRYIDKKLDGTHDREPEIIGEWSEENE